METMVIPPNKSNYSVLDGNESLSVQLDGGASRYRKDVLNSNSTVDVQWTTNSVGYEYIRAFYKTASISGSSPFKINLLLDKTTLTEHVAHFVPNTMRLVSVDGHRYVVSVKLDVKPQQVDNEYNNSLITVFTATNGKNVSGYINILEKLANVDLPNSLGY